MSFLSSIPIVNKQDLLSSFEDGVLILTFNRPARKNAITHQMYHDVTTALAWAEKQDQIVIVLFTGTGDYFSSGNDLNNFEYSDSTKEVDLTSVAKSTKKMIHDFQCALITFEKPIFAAVNGPAVGISVTMLALCDVVYGSEKSTFNTPFTKVGQNPEACSSITFQRIMGPSKANLMLLFNQTLNAHQAERCNFIAEVLPQQNFFPTVLGRVKEFAKLPPNLVRNCKKLIRSHSREELIAVSVKEVDLLEYHWAQPECINAILAFTQKKGKQTKAKPQSKL